MATLTKTQYHDLRRGYNHMVNSGNILKEIPDIDRNLSETLHLIARDVWKILMECEVVND